MKKESSGDSKHSKSKNLGATPLPIGEDDAARLVGGIVEKGFSDFHQSRPTRPPAVPRPTVLPFPVARHRSHGPHWAPKVGNGSVINDEDDDSDEEGKEDLEGMELAAGIANPVQRKEKKGLDFSRWKEMVKNDGTSLLNDKKNKTHSTHFEAGAPKAQPRKSVNLTKATADLADAKLSTTSNIDHAQEEYMEVNCKQEIAHKLQNGSSKEMKGDLKGQSTQESHMTSGFVKQNMKGGLDGSIQSEIDAENQAQLANMSEDEIAEAQAEIMAKLNPSLINALKKRGQSKRQKFSSSDVGTSSEADTMHNENKLSSLTKGSNNSTSDKPVKTMPQEAPKDKNDKASPNMIPQNRSMWDAWSKRVELVRDMRFSLDGNIIGSDSACLSDAGKALTENGYSANNVSERDFLRTEGDPGAAGYTIKEAVALTRSVVPGQRTLALHIIEAILDRAIFSLCKYQVGKASVFSVGEDSVDWEAIWAFFLGPETELALTLRMSIDDNHNSVVLACAKTIQSVLSYDMNEIIFDISEKTPTYEREVCTAPVFRSKPDINDGFLHGGFWKYNTKPSNILNFGEGSADDRTEGEHTIQDDVVVAGQDFAAGLVRMGIIPRICFLLEEDPAAPLEECLISILIAIARHSPTCAAAVMDCGRLVQTVVNRFSSKDQMEINSCKIKSVKLLKVLARFEKKNCLTMVKNGTFRKLTWHLYRYPFSLDQWAKSGKEACKLSSALLVEQLRFFKVIVNYGLCISDLSDLFPSLCIWLCVPTIEKLIENEVMDEYFAIIKEVYLLLNVLASRLPNFYSCMHEKANEDAQDIEANWLWTQFGQIIDLALEWIDLKNMPHASRLLDIQRKDDGAECEDSEVNSLLWVVSSVLNMLHSVLKALIPEDINDRLPWLPDFVPKIGLKIIKKGYFNFYENSSIIAYLCHLRLRKSHELAICSTCCLQGLVQLVASVDKLIHHANLDIHNSPSNFSREDKLLAGGILRSNAVELRDLRAALMKLITNEWQFLQPVEVFGRGGPAPGVGVGWGASGGGYWSLNTLLAQQDARLLVYLLEMTEIPSPKDPLGDDEMGCMMHALNCALSACLTLGPGNVYVVERLFGFIFKVSVMKCLDSGIRKFFSHRKGHKTFKWNYEEEDYTLFVNVLATHFRKRWLGLKKRRAYEKSKKNENHSLETIHEDRDEAEMEGDDSSSLRLEWAHQRLPLPVNWFLSSISTVHHEKQACPPGLPHRETCTDRPSDFPLVAKGGLFFLLGIELLPTFLTSEITSPATHIPIVWKLHALSAILLHGMGVLEDEKSRDVYESLQNVYGEMLDGNSSVGPMRFEADIHENYSTFIEALVEQFAAESYGDVLFARQVAMYLNRSVGASLRLATWNVLSNARVLELLPPLEKCFTKAESYLEPIEDDEKILEAYVKSWVGGALDKAATRNSVAFSMVLHHLSSFIFGSIVVVADTVSLRNKLVKLLLRDCLRKQHHEGMMMKLICYEKPNASCLPISQIEKRLQLLKEIDGNATSVQKLESCIRRDVKT